MLFAEFSVPYSFLITFDSPVLLTLAFSCLHNTVKELGLSLFGSLQLFSTQALQKHLNYMVMPLLPSNLDVEFLWVVSL